jgi:hypothetical protein
MINLDGTFQERNFPKVFVIYDNPHISFENLRMVRRRRKKKRSSTTERKLKRGARTVRLRLGKSLAKVGRKLSR